MKLLDFSLHFIECSSKISKYASNTIKLVYYIVICMYEIHSVLEIQKIVQKSTYQNSEIGSPIGSTTKM